MVNYETWVSVVRTEANRQGADLRQFDENSNVVSVAADIWNDRKQELQNATEREARRVAEGEVNVS